MENRLLYADPVSVNVRTAKGLAEHLRNFLACHASDLSEAVLVLIAHTRYMTAEELRQLYPVYSSDLMSHVIPKLLKEKQIARAKFDRPRGDSRFYYVATRRGINDTHALLSENKLAYKAPNVTSGNIAHSYYAGYNLFQILKLSLPVEWHPEYIGSQHYDLRKGKSRQNIHQVDALCIVDGGRKSEQRIYFEEDTGSENVSVLLDKMERYYALSYLDDVSDMVVFSCVKPNATSCTTNRHGGVNPFSEKKAIALYKYMDEKGCDDAYSLLSDDEFADKEYLRVFLSEVDGLSHYADGRNKRGGITVTKAFVSEYRKSLSISQNPYKATSVNMEHLSYAKARLHLVVKSLIESFMTYAWSRPAMYGSQVLFIPTTLVADRMRYAMMSRFPALTESIAKSLYPYFGELSFEGEVTGPVGLENGFSDSSFNLLSLRNCFTYRRKDGQKGKVYVETPFTDAASWLRCYQFLRFYKGSIPVNIVCIFENEEQAGIFYRLFDYDYDDMNLALDKSGIFAMNFGDVGKTVPLYIMDSFSDYEEKRTFVTSL